LPACGEARVRARSLEVLVPSRAELEGGGYPHTQAACKRARKIFRSTKPLAQAVVAEHYDSVAIRSAST
jgi:hypothetical protein